jgi:hypothetical protein
VIEVASAKAKRLTEAMVNANIGNPFSWLNDNATILEKCFLKNRAALLDAKKIYQWPDYFWNAD